MKFLPLAMTKGPLLAEAIRAATPAGRAHGLCGYCGERLMLASDLPRQTVRCPSCMRRQDVCLEEEKPWRLTPGAAEALRRSRTWLRRL